MEYKVVEANTVESLTKKVNSLIELGWEPVGSHQSQVRHMQNRYRGSDHMDSIYTLEYTQTLVKK